MLVFLVATGAGWAFACAALIAYLRDWLESPGVLHVLTIICLVFAGLPMLTLPFELTNLSSDTSNTPVVAVLHRARAFDWLFEFTRYAVLLLLFVLVPCALIASHSVNRGATAARALCRGVFVALCTALCGLVIGFAGAALKELVDDPTDTPQVVRSPWHADMGVALNSLFAVTMVVGLGFMSCHTALSLSELPVQLAAPPMAREVEHMEQGAALLAQTREELRRFRSSFELRGRAMGKKEQARLAELHAREQALIVQVSRAEQAYCTGGLQTRHAVMRAVAGYLVLLVLFFVVSLIYSLVEQARTSSCGLICGFKPPTPRELHPTPLDVLLLLCAKLFPLDAVVVAMYTLLVLSATGMAVRARCSQIGCLPSSTLRPRGSVASSLVTVAAAVLLSGFTLTAQFVIAAPEYAAYGLQSRPYLSDSVARCSAIGELPAALALPLRLNTSSLSLSARTPMSMGGSVGGSVGGSRMGSRMGSSMGGKFGGSMSASFGSLSGGSIRKGVGGSVGDGGGDGEGRVTGETSMAARDQYGGGEKSMGDTSMGDTSMGDGADMGAKDATDRSLVLSPFRGRHLAADVDTMGSHKPRSAIAHVCGLANAAILVLTLEREVPYFQPVWFFANCLFAAVHLVGATVAAVRYVRQRRIQDETAQTSYAGGQGSANGLGEQTPLTQGKTEAREGKGAGSCCPP